MEKSTFEPRDPDWERKVRESFASQKVMATLGAELLRVVPGHCEIRLPCRDELTQQHGFIQAGIVSAIADNAGGYAGFSLFPADSSVLTVEFKINLIAPAQGERLLARGQVVKSGRTLTVCALEVFALDGAGQAGDGATRKLCASGQQTLICLHGRADV